MDFFPTCIIFTDWLKIPKLPKTFQASWRRFLGNSPEYPIFFGQHEKNNSPKFPQAAQTFLGSLKNLSTWMVQWRVKIKPHHTILSILFVWTAPPGLVYSLYFRTKRALNETRGVWHDGLAIYIKKYLKAKEELWKLKYFTMQKYNLQKDPLKETKIFQDIITL
jgi:hypothetical protein